MNKCKSTLIIGFAVLFMGSVSGCVSNCDPNNPSRLCSASYAVGANSEMEGHLTARKAHADSLQQEVDDARARMETSKKSLADAEIKLAEVKKNTGPAGKRAREVSAEMKLKRRDLERKNRYLTTLEKQLIELRKDQSNKSESLVKLDVVSKELKIAKTEISELEEYLKVDLLIRAENAAKYD